MKHPDVTAYAQFFPLSAAEMASIEKHLQQCGECRDLVLFIRKTNATLRQEGRIARVAKALRTDIDDIKREMRLGTSIDELINRPPDTSVKPTAHPSATGITRQEVTERHDPWTMTLPLGFKGIPE